MPSFIENFKAKRAKDDTLPNGTPQEPKESPDGTRTRSARAKWIGFLELFTVALIATFLGAFGARVTPIDKVGVNLTINAQPPVVTKNGGVRAVGVAYFPNGTAQIDREATAGIERWARALSGCKDARFLVIGSTSSVPFRPGSQGSNLDLAKARSKVVAAILKKGGVASVEPQTIDEKGLVRERLLNDQPSGQRNAALEAVARRADILFEDLGNCRIPDDPKQ